MAQRPKSKIQRGFVLGYLAVAVMVVATGFALRNVEPISADLTWVTPQGKKSAITPIPTVTSTMAVPTPTGSPTDTFQWEGCVDGHDQIYISGDALAINHLLWKPIGTHTVCKNLGNTSTYGTFTGNLAGCEKVSLTSKTARGSLTLAKDTPIFVVDLNDNAPSAAAIYKFTLTCTQRSETTATPTTSKTATTTKTAKTSAEPTSTAKAVAPSCMVGSTAKAVKLLDRDKQLFGANAKAYLVTTTDKRYFRIIVGGSKVSSTDKGGKIQLSYGFQNLNPTTVGSATFGYLRYSYKSNGKVQTAVLDFRNKGTAAGAYFKGTKTIDVSDFSQATPNLKMLKGSTAIACLANPIKLSDITTGTTPTPTLTPTLTPTDSATVVVSPTASPTTEYISYNFKTGFNTIVAPNATTIAGSKVLDTENISEMNMYLYDFNRLGQKNWRTTNSNAGTNYGLIPQLFDNVGYYVYNPGPELTVQVPVITKNGPSSVEEKTKLRKGWNIMANSSNKAQKLSEISVYVTKKDAAATCLEESCIEKVTLRDLFTGDSATRRAYRTIYEIKDGTATTSDAAFNIVRIDTTNLDSVTIPAGMPFWVYLWN